MRTILANMAWPALYVSTEIGKFWYLVFATILIEAIVIKVFHTIKLVKLKTIRE
jgi:hypothetical protein